MSGAVQSCPTPQVEDPCKKMDRLMSRGVYQDLPEGELEAARAACCEKLAGEIDDLVDRHRGPGEGGTKGLKQRFPEQNEGPNGPPGSGVGDPEVWETHDQAIKEQQKGLRDRLEEFNKGNCGEKQKIPEDAWEWATKPAPKPEEWTGPATAPSERTSAPVTTADSSFMRKMGQLTGLTGAALLTYVIISEGSRLFPPRNLVPVP
jgi:hypothetical protein